MSKSPLRCPGGKQRALKHILPYFPEDLDSICSPFFGGGSIELALAERGVFVAGYDGFGPLVNFWNQLLFNKEKLVKAVYEYKDSLDQCLAEEKELAKVQFKIMKGNMSFVHEDMLANGTFKYNEKDVDRAALYFALNRSSFSGTVLSGGYSTCHPRFNTNSVKRLEKFNLKHNNVTVQHKFFPDSISSHKNLFLYCDPPYIIDSNLYGDNGDMHKSFDHVKLSAYLKTRSKWILSYNNCPEVLELYKGYEIVYPKWKYGMGDQKDSKEVLIINY